MAARNATIGALRVELGLDSAQFDAGLKQSRGKLLDFKRGVGTGLDELEAGFRSSAKSSGILGAALSGMGLAGVAAGAGIAAVATAVVAARKAFAFADDIADQANRLAVSTKALQEYRYAVHALGGEYEDADAALEGFSKAFGAASSGISKKAIKPFQALFGPDFNPKQFATTEDALQAVIDKISRLSSTAEQASIADKLGLSSMLPAIRAGTGAIDEARAAAERLGFVMDDALIQKGGEANDRMEDLKTVLDVQVNGALIELAPAILAVGNAFVDAAHAVGDMAKELGKLNDWAASKDLLAVFRWANQAGDAFGQATGLNKTAGALGFKSGPAAPQASRAGILAAMAPKPLARDGKLSPIPGGDGASKAKAASKASQAVVDAAIKDELDARTALVRDVQKRAELERQAVDTETKAANDRLQQRVKDKEITDASAQVAIALNNKAAAEKKSLIDQDLQQKLDDQLIQQRQAIGAYYDRIASITASMAGTAAERNAIEAKSLEAQQKLDADALSSKLAQQVTRDEITQSEADALIAAQKDLQATERAAQAREATARLEDEANQKAEAAIELQIDLLRSQADLTQTSYARGKVEEKILKWEHELERLQLEAIVHSATATAAQKAIAQARLDQLKAIQGNEAKAQRDTNSLMQGIADAASALKSFTGAIKSHDWGGAVSGLANTFTQLGGLLGAGGLGGALSKVGKFLGPIGSIVSSVTGIFGDLFGSSKKKRAARVAKEQEAAAAQAKALQDAATKAQDIANTKRELEISIMEASGDAVGALAARRADELGAMDESLRGLQLNLYAKQDLADAYDRESSALKDTISNARAAAKSLRDYSKALAQGAAGQLSLSAQLRVTSAAFNAAIAANDNEGLKDASEAYLNALAKAAPDQFALARGVAQVRAAIEAAANTADDQASIAEQQLDALTASVSGLIEVNQSVLTVAQAIDNLARGLAITPTAQNDNGPVTDFTAYVDNHPDLLAQFNAQTGLAAGRTKEQYGQIHYANVGYAEGRTTTGAGPAPIPGFKTGGNLTVGGWGGADSQLTQLRTTPGEMVSVSRKDTMSDLVAEMRSVRDELSTIKAAAIQTTLNTGASSKTLKRWDDDGAPITFAA